MNPHNLPLIFTYWHDKSIMPPFVKLCTDIMKVVFRNDNFHFYDKAEVISEFDIRSDLWEFHHLKNETVLNEAARSDYIRNKILLKYGGIWIDADTIVMQSFAPLLRILDAYEYFGRRQEAGFIGINFMGSRPGGRIVKEYLHRQNKMLDLSLVVKGGSHFGSRLITDVIAEAEPLSFHILPESAICPINFKNWKLYFSKTALIEDFIDPSVYCFMLFNRGFPESFRSMSICDIFNQNWLVSDIFNYVIDKYKV